MIQHANWDVVVCSVDQEEVHAWFVNHLNHEITPRRYIYHQDTPYNVVCPGDTRECSDFVHQWAIYTHGRLTGRTASNLLELNVCPTADVAYRTLREAQRVCAIGLRRHIKRLVEESMRLRVRLSNLPKRARGIR